MLGSPDIDQAFCSGSLGNVTAYVQDSTLTATHDSVSVQAVETAQITATTDDETTSLASGLANESSSAYGALLATNMVNAAAKAYVDGSSTIHAGGALSVVAKDDAGIHATNTQVVSSTTISDG